MKSLITQSTVQENIKKIEEMMDDGVHVISDGINEMGNTASVTAVNQQKVTESFRTYKSFNVIHESFSGKIYTPSVNGLTDSVDENNPFAKACESRRWVLLYEANLASEHVLRMVMDA